MEFRQLRSFVEVVRQGGFSQAAKTIFSTQSAISKSVRQLEDELGVQLLDRIGHRSKLTTPGEVVYRRAVKMLEDRDDLVAELNEMEGLKRGTLRLAVALGLSSTLFAPIFAAYRGRYPGIDIRVTENGGQRAKELLLAGEVDFGCSLLPVTEEFDWKETMVEPLMALLPSGHRLANNESVDLASLQDSPFILFEESASLHRILIDACRRRGFEPNVVSATNHIDFMVNLVSENLGVAFLPKTLAKQHRRPGLGTVLLAEPQTEWHSAVLWRRGAYLSPAAKAWLRLMDEFLGVTRKTES